MRGITILTLATALCISAGWSAAHTPDAADGAQPTQTSPQPRPIAVNIGGRQVLIAVNLWRNLQPPVTDQPASGLNATVNASTRDRRGLPDGLVIRSIRAIQGRQEWRSPLSRMGVADQPNAIVRATSGGPAWDAGSRATVVIEYSWRRLTWRAILRNVTVQAVY